MKILIVGDSFSYGHGCDDRLYYYDENAKQWVGDNKYFLKREDQIPSNFCYGSLIQNDFTNCTVFNKSIPGADNMTIFRELVDHINFADLVLFNLSTPNRMQCSTELPADTPASWVLGQHEWHPEKNANDYYKAHEYFLKYLYHEQWFMNIALSAVYAAYGLCTAKRKKIYWSAPYFLNHTYLRENENYVSFKKDLENIQGWMFESLNDYNFPTHENTNENSIYRCVDKHANNMGHHFYYNVVIKPIIVKELFLHTRGNHLGSNAYKR